MKIKYLWVLPIVGLMACNGNGDRSDAYGNFETDETIVSAEVAGKLVGFSAEPGDQLTAGQTIALVDTTQLALQMKQIEAQQQAVSTKKLNIRAEVNVLQEQIRNLEITRKRIHNMFADQAATRQQVDDVDGQMRVLEKQVQRLNTQFVSVDSEMDVLTAQLAVVSDQLRKCTVVSPLDGVVLEKYVEFGELATPGKALVKLADLSELELRVYVSGARLPQIKIGQPVEVIIDQDETTNQRLHGQVSWISPEAEFTPKIIQTKEERVKLVYAVKVKVKNDGRLKIGMPGEVNFQ